MVTNFLYIYIYILYYIFFKAKIPDLRKRPFTIPNPEKNSRNPQNNAIRPRRVKNKAIRFPIFRQTRIITTSTRYRPTKLTRIIR